MLTRTIVILANSIKHHNHCVAGKCLTTKEWIRPVANNDGAELSDAQIKIENPYGQFNVKPKQRVEIGLLQKAPLPHQPENFIVSDYRWQQKYTIDNSELEQYLDTPTSLWGGGDHVPYFYIQNKLIEITQSLYLVKVESLELYKTPDNKRRASFNYQLNAYDLAVTDPNFDKIVANDKQTNGILCISLGEQFSGNCYKLVATIFLEE